MASLGKGEEPATPFAENTTLSSSSSLRILTLNCWGLKFISKHRRPRLTEIGRQIALCDPPPDIVGLQECWTQEDYLSIRAQTEHMLPHGKFYWSGCFGGGLAILSRWPIEESGMLRYPLNGRPQAFWRGDWYVGKGVASARIRMPARPGHDDGGGGGDRIEVFCTHLHAPYEKEPHDSYICHRTAQAWEIAKLMRHARERGSIVVGVGDFNMLPGSLACDIIQSEVGGGVRDVWRLVHPASALGSAETEGGACPSARDCLDLHGATCDSTFNTWRWSEQRRKDLDRGSDSPVDADAEDPKAKRLDYIFFADRVAPRDDGTTWAVEAVNVGMTMRHPTLQCSLSDHFSVEATFTLTSPPAPHPPPPPPAPLPLETLTRILSLITSYTARERHQRRLRIAHFFLALATSLACFVAVWWSPHNFVAFLLSVLSTLGFAAGVVDGLIGFLFVGSELRALREFRWEVENCVERGRGRRRRGGEGEGEGEGDGEGDGVK